MAWNARVFEILIASPSDVADERQAIREAILDWNASHRRRRECVLLPVMWETHASPALGDRPQAIINKQLVDECDGLIGAFWTRLGTATGVAPSGTVEEIERIREQGKPVMLFFVDRPISPNLIDSKQLTALNKYKDDLCQRGLLETAASVPDLSNKLHRHLNRLVDQLVASGVQPASPSVVAGRVSAEATETYETIRRLQNQWELNSMVGRAGADDCQYCMREFLDLYVESKGSFGDNEPMWAALAALGQQLVHYRFTMGPDSGPRFFGVGNAVLASALALSRGKRLKPVLSGLKSQVIITLGRQDEHTMSLSEMGKALGGPEGAIESCLEELEHSKLVKVHSYFNADRDYALTPEGIVRAAIESAASPSAG